MRHHSRTPDGYREQTTLPEHPTIEVVASALFCCPATVWRLVQAGKLTGRRYLGRTVFDRGQVEQLVRERAR